MQRIGADGMTNYSAKEIANKIKIPVRVVAKIISQYHITPISYFWENSVLKGRYEKDKVDFIKKKAFFKGTQNAKKS